MQSQSSDSMYACSRLHSGPIQRSSGFILWSTRTSRTSVRREPVVLIAVSKQTDSVTRLSEIAIIKV